MKCNEIRELLSLYIDRMLDEDQLKKVEEHISACEACRNEYNEMKEMLDLLGQAEMLPVPDAFEFRLKKALKEEKQNMIDSGLIGKPSKKKNQWRIITSVAAVFAVGVLSFGLYHDVLDIVPNQLNGTEQSDQAQIEEDGALENNEIYSAELGDESAAPSDLGDESISMKQQTSEPDDTADSNIADSSITEEEKIKMFTYGVADGQAAGGSEAGNAESGSNEEYDAPMENTAMPNASFNEVAGYDGEVLKSRKLTPVQDSSRSLTSSGVERNAAAVQYYDNLIAEKLKDFDYEVLESSYSKTGEWQFRIFIFRGKDGNTYNEEIMIIGKDGKITVDSDEFMEF